MENKFNKYKAIQLYTVSFETCSFCDKPAIGYLIASNFKVCGDHAKNNNI